MSPHAHLLDSRQAPPYRREQWSPLMISAAEIDTAFTALEAGEPDDRGRREMLIVHPQAPNGVRGLAPATQVSLGVLLPGESTVPVRANTTGLSMCLAGNGTVSIGARTMRVVQQDVWTKPSMNLEALANNGTTAFRYLRYTNAALLEAISAYYEDFGSTVETHDHDVVSAPGRRAKDLAPAIALGDDGSQLLPYEHIIDPDPITDSPLLFAWAKVSQHLSGVLGLKTGYTGRPLYCLYNPSTGRLNGTTPSFFATVTAIGGDFAGGTHRHMSSAINYHFAGNGYSIVEGQRFDWSAGDLMLSAPGWAAHAHTISGEGARILTVQDHPLHTSTGSLVWQEDIDNGEVLALGTQTGFETNLAEYAAQQ
jgi:gentisate 1,2-dioxygenase